MGTARGGHTAPAARGELCRARASNQTRLGRLGATAAVKERAPHIAPPDTPPPHLDSRPDRLTKEEGPEWRPTAAALQRSQAAGRSLREGRDVRLVGCTERGAGLPVALGVDKPRNPLIRAVSWCPTTRQSPLPRGCSSRLSIQAACSAHARPPQRHHQVPSTPATRSATATATTRGSCTFPLQRALVVPHRSSAPAVVVMTRR